MRRRVSISDVAREAGVSVATVSKAVNGRYGVAAATAERVLQVVEQLGYETSLVASSMRSHRTGVIGILVPDFEPFSAEVLKGVAGVLRGSRYELMAYSGTRQHSSAGWERRSLSRLSGTLIDGAILVTPTVLDVSADVPVVAIDPHTGPAGLPTVESDSFGGALEAVAHLIGLGHRRIGYVAGRPDLRSSRLREAGYRQALSDAGIPFDPSLVRVGLYEHDISRETATEMLSRADRPTAVFAANDLSAIATMESATALGLSIPHDVSVVGFDDIPEAARTNPPLSTVKQGMQALGGAAADILVTLMEGREPQSMHVRLTTRLVLRGTTAPPA
ncbi:LacI family DNA-binding transcriptional regulator [Schumannella luteola]